MVAWLLLCSDLMPVVPEATAPGDYHGPVSPRGGSYRCRAQDAQRDSPHPL